MRICYSFKLCVFSLAVALSPLSAQDAAEEDQIEVPVENGNVAQEMETDDASELENWLFAIGSAVAAAIGITVVSLSQGKTAHN